MNRALAVLTCGAFFTLLIGVVGSGDAVLVIPLGAVFTVLGTVGFGWVQRRGQLGWAVAYVAAQLPLIFVIFANDPSVGATLLLVALVCQCVLLLPLPGTALVVALTPFVHLGMSWSDALREGIGTLLSALFGAVVTELSRRERQARAELSEAHEKLRDYAAQAERLATVQERNRVARDIHDGLGHSLTVVQMQVKAARAVLPTDSAKADAVLEKAQEQAEAALTEVRRSVRALREPRVTPPLPEGLRGLAEETSAAGIPTQLVVSGTERPLPAETREALYRAAQEGLTNVRKHSKATRVGLVLEYTEEEVRLEIRDNGTGIADEQPPGYGLMGLRERAAQVGGQLHVELAPGQGFTLTMEVPDDPRAGAAGGRPGALS